MLSSVCQCLLLGAFLVGFPCATAAQARHLYPVDETDRDASFREFKELLERAVKTRDVSFLLGILDPRITNSFGGDGGVEEFRETWRPENADSEVWDILGLILSLGVTEESGREGTLFCAPYVFRRFPDELDPFEHYAVIRSDAPLRIRAEPDAPITGRVSYEIVEGLEWLPSQNERKLDSWVKVRTSAGAEGFMSARDVWSPVGYRAGFKKKQGKWVMTFLVAGD